MDQQIIDYIKKEKDKGFSNEQIKNILIKAGHDIEKINEHISHHENTVDNSNENKTPNIFNNNNSNDNSSHL